MNIAIMQPYFLPYIGYWQLIQSVDKFIIYDNIQYTKKGWINRNNFLFNNSSTIFTVPIKKDSDYLDINKRTISSGFENKIINKLKVAYSKAPQFEIILPLIKDILYTKETNLFNYLYSSVKKIVKFLEIDTKIIVSSSIKIDHNLKSQNKVIEICKNLKASHYINTIGGQDLYSKNDFIKNNINLSFIKSEITEYNQFKKPFIPYLSIIDVLMFNNKIEVKKLLAKYKLL